MPHHHICLSIPSYLPYRHPFHPMSSYLPYHHPCHVITTFVFHWVCLAIVSLAIALSLLNSFVINENHIQHSPHFTLMENSKHSPPLTTMTKDNLLCQCCTYFDIGFHFSLLFNNSSCHHISPLTKLGYLTNLLEFILTFHILEWYLRW